jgi:hypothetical protein
MSEPRDDFERRFARRYAEYLEDGAGTTDTRKVMAAVTRDTPRRAGWVRMAMLGTATVAAAVVITLLAVGVLPITGPVGDSSDSPQASVGPSATAGPSTTSAASATPASTPSGTPPQPVAVPWPTLAPSEASVPSSLDGQNFAFWTLYYPPPCCTSLLRISTSAGSSDRVIEIPGASGSLGFPEPAGPAAGRVVYVVNEGLTWHLRVADARTGADSELTSTSLVIGRVAIDPGGSTAYYMLFDRFTRDFQGLWAIPTSGGQPTPVVSVAATTGMATLAATRVYEDPQLAVSDDGSRIAYVLCYTTYCEFHAIHADGTADPIDWSNFHTPDRIVGITGDLLIGATECSQLTCDGFVLDLRTGERWPLGGDEAPFAPGALIAGPHGPLVLSESTDWDQGRLRVDALDLTDGSRSTAFEATFVPGTNEAHLAQGRSLLDYFSGAELPAGWFLIARFGAVDAGVLPPPDYSAATVGDALETGLPFMESPTR